MNIDRVEKLVRLFGCSRARELVVEAEGWQVSLRRGTAPSPHPASVPAAEPSYPYFELPVEPPDLTAVVTAPVVGIFREGGTAIRVGDSVPSGTTLGSIESMKILNPVVAAVGGEVVEVLVEDGHPVEFGQHLYRLIPQVEAAGEEAEPWSGE